MTPEYDDYGVLIKRPTAAKPQVDDYGVEIKKKSGGDVSTSGSGTTTTSTSSGSFPLLYDREKTESMPALISGSKGLPKQEKTNFTQVQNYKKPETFNPEMTDKEAKDEAMNSFQRGDHAIDPDSQDPAGDILKQVELKKYSYPEYKVAAEKTKMITEGFFNSGEAAKDYLQKHVLGVDINHLPIEEVKAMAGNNVTKQLAAKRYEQLRNVEESLHNRTLDEASLVYAAKSDPQVAYLLNKAGGIGGMEESNSAIPLAMRGEKKLQFLMNPDVKELVRNNPDLKREYGNEIANFPSRHPEYATKLLADAIAKRREENGENNWFANVVGKESTDKIVDELIKEGQFPVSYKYLYQKAIRPKLGTGKAIGRGIGNLIPGLNQVVNEGPIPTPGILEGAEQGFENFQVGTAKSIANLTGIQNELQPEAQQIFNTLEKDYSTPTLEPKGLLHKISSHGGNLIGFVAGLAGGTSALNATKLLNPQVAQGFTMVLATHGDANERAKTLFPGEKLKQGVYVGTMDILNGVMGKYLPGGQISKLLKPQENIIASTLKKMVDGEITTDAAKGVITNLVANTVKGSLKGGEFMGAIAGVDDLLTQTLQGKGIDFSQSLDKAWDSFKIGMLATAPLSGVEAALKSNKPFRNEIISIADRPDYYKELANREAETNPDFAKIKDEVIENIDFVSKVKGEISGKDWTDNQKKDYIINSLAEKVKLAKAEAATDPTIKKQLQKEAKNLHEIKDAALKGVEPEKVKENQAIKEVKEFYDNDFLSKGAREMLESIEGENGKPKFNEGKVKKFLEFIAQQSNNVTEDGKFNTGSDARKSVAKQYPSQIIELANEMFPEYAKTAGEGRLPDFFPAKEERLPDYSVKEEIKPHVPATEVDAEKGVELPNNVHEIPDIKTDEAVSKAKTGKPFSFTAYRKETSDSHDLVRGVYFGDKEIAQQFMDKGQSGKGASMNKYYISFKNPLVISDKDAFVRELAKNGDREAQELIPEYENDFKFQTKLNSYDFDTFINRKAKELGHDGIISDLEYVALDKDVFKKISNETSTTKGEAKETTPIPNEAEATGGEPPTPTETVPETSAGSAEGEKMRLTHADTEKIYKEGGLPERLETPTKHLAELEKEANAKLEKGYDFDKVAQDVMDGKHKWEDSDQLLFAKKVADLKAKQNNLDIKSPEFDALQTQIEKLSRASDVAGTEAGRTLQSRKGYVPVEETISDYITRKKEANGVDTLTDRQKEDVKKEFTEITDTEKAYKEKIQALRDENTRLRAEAEVKKAKSTAKKDTKKDYKKEREEIFTSIKDKLKAARGDTSATIVPYAKELFAIAPDVAKLVKNYVEQGITELGEIIKNVHGGLKEEIEGITEKDVRDLIAGEYNKKKKTRNELAARRMDLKIEAQLINKLEALERGEEPKSERKKIHRNQKIKELREKIKGFKTKKSAEETLASMKTRMANEIKKIEAQLKSGDFAKEETDEFKLDQEAKDLQDKLIKLRQQREERLIKEEYAKSSFWNKAQNEAANLLNAPRTLMSSVDYSAPLRQALFATTSHPIMASKAFSKMFKASWSEKYYDRWFDNLKNSDNYKLMHDSNLAVTDVDHPHLSAKEEAYMSNLPQKVPLLGKLIKGSERAYSMYLNKMRVDIFNEYAAEMQRQGKTFENSSEEYKQMAAFVNNITGRGDLGETLNKATPVLSGLFFSPRLIASRLNTLTYMAQPRFWNKLPQQARVDYFKGLLATAGIGLSILALAKAAGAETEDDPRSPDFGKIKSGNTRWDIWGGHQQYIRVAAQLWTNQRKSSTSGKITDMGTGDPYSGSRGQLLGGFLRGKLAPVPSLGVDILSGQNAIGDKITSKWASEPGEVGIGENLATHLLPLVWTGMNEAIKDQGQRSWFTVAVPAVFGVGTNTYEKKESSSGSTKKPTKSNYKKTSKRTKQK